MIKKNIDAENEEDFPKKCKSVLKNESFDAIKKKELSYTEIVIIVDYKDQLFDDIEIKKIEETQNGPFYIRYQEFLNGFS